MKASASIIVIAAIFLSVGALAGNRLPAQIQKFNVTVVSKNQAWPVKGQITTEACKVNRCWEA